MKISVESARGCGFRSDGGMYLVSEPGAVMKKCGKLPFPLGRCPTCAGGIKQSRGWTWINPAELFGKAIACILGVAKGPCNFCEMAGEAPDRGGLLWVGERYYSPESFVEEMTTLGVSKRIAALPRDFVPGETWVYFAHPRGSRRPCDHQGMVSADGVCLECPDCEGSGWIIRPAIFYATNRLRVQKVIAVVDDEIAAVNMKIDMAAYEDAADEMARLEKRGIEPVIVVRQKRPSRKEQEHYDDEARDRE